MLLIAPAGRILWVNEAASRILGRLPAELIGAPLGSFLSPQEAAISDRLVGRVLCGEVQQTEREETWLRADGSQIWLQVSFSLATDAHDQPLRVGPSMEACLICQFVDVTDRKQEEAALAKTRAELVRRNAELERMNEELSEFAYVISHDLSEPLRVIAGHVQLLADRYGSQLDADAHEWIAFAVDGCSRMRCLIDDLLQYSRAARDDQPLLSVDSRAVLEGSLSGLATAIAETHAEVTIGDLPHVVANPVQLGQVFSNLIGNAIKYVRPGESPRIDVTAERLGDWWTFTVADAGIGVPERHRERVFKLFQRLQRRGEGDGSGIGLAICRKVVQRHGGRIWVVDSQGGGAAFRFTLPAGETDV